MLFTIHSRVFLGKKRPKTQKPTHSQVPYFHTHAGQEIGYTQQRN